MTYFRFKGKDDLWLGKFGKSERTLIPNELLTKKEIDKIKKDCPRLSVEKTFKEVELSPNETYVNFGVRFENGTDHNSKLESRTMGRKLHIKENVVSDMYRLKIINIDEVKNDLQGFMYKINLETCSLVPIDKPRTYAAAKKSEFPILGIVDNSYMYAGWNKPRKTGPAVAGIYGQDYFMSTGQGDDKVRANFDNCDRFYQVVPDDIETYETRYDVSKDRTNVLPAKLDDAGNIDNSRRNTLHKSRAFTQDDVDAYNPEVNRRRYVNILTKNHLNKFVSEYNDACATVKSFQNRLNNIDITSVNGYSYGYALDAFKEVISRLKSLNDDIGSISGDNKSAWRTATESDIESDIERFDDAVNKLEKRMQDIEKSSGVSESYKKRK